MASLFGMKLEMSGDCTTPRFMPSIVIRWSPPLPPCAVHVWPKVTASPPTSRVLQVVPGSTAASVVGVLVFDNGFNVRDSSRAIELDLRGTDVRPVWQWQPARPNRAPAVGSARRLPGGNTLVAFGMSKGRAATGPIEVYEVDAAGQTVWHLELENAFQMYRAEPWPSIGSERVLDETQS